MYTKEALSPGSVDPRLGTGDWDAYTCSLDPIFDAARAWAARLHGVSKPWLCWNVSPHWSHLQQRLVASVGWTPVVGFDPRVGPPPLLPQSILIDFNEPFKFPVMWPHFPLEFAFLFTPRIAFWHADLLCRPRVMEQLAAQFERLEDGQMSAVLDKGGRRNWLNVRTHRYWELCGCTTRGASENQFYNGTGWWRWFDRHPKCRTTAERARRRSYSYDSGVGILYWKNNYRGSVIDISIRLVYEGHCSEIANPRYVSAPNHTTALRDLPSELEANYSLSDVANRLELSHFMEGIG
jgi:hypothetical protein